MNVLKTVLMFSAVFLFAQSTITQAHNGEHIKTTWGEQLNPQQILPEYPRPIMERKAWMNLNGSWNYKILPCDELLPEESTFEGQIIVPFPLESNLSGVAKTIDEKSCLWYQRTFKAPKNWANKRVLLHFGGVDWKTTVWVNGTLMGNHTGAYSGFTFDITDALKKDQNSLVVRVWDPSDKGPQPRGKQVCHPEGCFYTPVTGIWQTVWLEPVEIQHIKQLRITPDIDRCTMQINASCEKTNTADKVIVSVYDGTKLIATTSAINHQPIEVKMPKNSKLWTPDTPFLYDVYVSLYHQGKIVDKVKSYAAMRKYSKIKEANGIWRFQLNNQTIFPFGPLDQGWWPDGLYTAPTDEALAFDIKKTKDFGYNLIRKHVKVEPERWYTYCDKLGIMVWQDMPSGDKMAPWQNTTYHEGTEMMRSPESEEIYRKEWKEIMDQLYSYPCIGAWVPFNEGWGQFKTIEMVKWTQQYDPTRLVNPASGGNHFKCGDILDLHNYPEPKMYLYDPNRLTILGEYGGIGYPIKGHLWVEQNNWGYVQFNSPKEVLDKYEEYSNNLKELIGKGFSAAIYTQTTDVEIEINGLMTYDRKVIKLDENRLKAINQSVIQSLK